MPFKHQAECYRTFDGVRWPNLCDVLDGDQEDEVRARKAAGHRIRLIKHPDGYRQAFIRPEDLARKF